MPRCFIDFNLTLFKFLRPKYTALGTSAPLAHFDSPKFSSLQLIRSVQDPGLLQDQFPSVPVSTYFSPASNALFLQIIVNIAQLSLSWFSKRTFFPSGIFLNTFFTVISSGIPATCPNHRNLLCQISEIISGSLYRFIQSWMVLILHMPFTLPGPNIFSQQFTFLYC